MSPPRRDLVALLAALVALVLGGRLLRLGLDTSEPRRGTLRAILRDAQPERDLVVFTDDSAELVVAAAPVPAVAGLPLPPADLAGFRRLHVLALTEPALAGYFARLGTPSATFTPTARSWNLTGVATVRVDLSAHLTDGTITARREGGVHAGPCEPSADALRCRSTDEWNHIRADEHPVGGVNLRCIFAHPQADGRLVIEAPNVVPARNLVGMVAIDDRALVPNGAPVTTVVTFRPTGGGPSTQRTVVAPNRQGATPYNLPLGGRAGSLSFAITTPMAGARSHCFTAYVTD